MRKASNNEIKLLRKLNRKKHREKEQLFIVEGERAVTQVVENNLVKVETIFVAEGKAVSDLLPEVTVCVEGDLFEEVADTDNTQGILAVCEMPSEISLGALAEQSGLVVATDSIQDPGNMGTILRTAAWFGSKALVAGKGSVDVYNPKVVRSTAGATGSIPVHSGSLEEVLRELEKSGWKVLLLDGGGNSVPLRSVQPDKKTILVVGNEGNGINDALLNSHRMKVKIESSGSMDKVESLNAAVAVSIAFWAIASKG